MGTWDKRVKRICVGALITAALLRAAGSGSLAAMGRRGAELLQDRNFAAFLLYLQTGRRIPASCLAVEMEPETTTVPPTEDTEPETEPVQETEPADFL